MRLASDPINNEVVSFIQHQRPGLEDGVYQLKVLQTVFDVDDQPISDDTLHNEYTFAVQGDRFSLANPNLIDSVFPAGNASGEFTTVLPHVVFSNTTFPWSRDPYKPKLVEDEAEPDAASWLAVLLLDEDDLTSAALTKLPPGAATVGDLFPKRLNGNSTLDDNYSYFENAKDTSLEPGEELSDPIQYIDLKLSFFWQIAPTIDDLKLLAHVRKVSLINKPTLAGGVGPGTPLGTYSIVFGNRLPQTAKKTYAYLVSLQNLEAFLPDDQGGPPPGNAYEPSKFLRLAVLTSWTFYSTGESATFVNQLLSLNGRTPEGPDAVNTNLRLLYKGANRDVANAAQMGYAPLNTNLRTGEKAVSWYRGPLTPYKVTPGRIHVPISSPDAANAFDPTTGVFDQSYGAAWSVGRLLALQDTGFSTALYNWKTGLTQQVVDEIEDQILQNAFQAVLAAGPVPAALAGAERITPALALLHKTMQALAQQE